MTLGRRGESEDLQITHPLPWPARVPGLSAGRWPLRHGGGVVREAVGERLPGLLEGGGQSVQHLDFALNLLILGQLSGTVI